MTDFDEWPVQVGLDSNRMLEHVGPFAQDAVRRNGLLWPCGVGVTVSGELEPFMVGDNFPTLEDAFNFMIANLIADRDHWRAVCCAVAVTRPDGGDALNFTVEHATGQCFVATMPYYRTRVLRQIAFEELSVIATKPLIWSWQDGTDILDDVGE